MGWGGKTMGTLAEAMAPSTQVDRAGRLARRRGAGIGLDDGAVLGHEAQDAGAQRGDGQAELQAGAGDEGGVDGPDAVLAAARASASASGSRLRTELPLVRRWRRTRGRRSPAPASEAHEVALPFAAGLAGLAPPLRSEVLGGTTLVAREHGARRQGEGRAGALGDLLVDLAAERGAVERAEPGCLPKTCSVWVQARTSPSISLTRSSNSSSVRAWARAPWRRWRRPRWR